MTALALTIAVQGQTETVDTAQFVAMYDYECRTLNDEDVPITARMQIVLQVGRTMTKCMPRSQYGVRGVPSNYLIDCSTGKIVATHLRGDALTAKLAELFE